MSNTTPKQTARERRRQFEREAAEKLVVAQERLLMLANAQFIGEHDGSNGVGAALQKSVLLVIAAHDGQPISYNGLCERCSCSRNSAFHAVRLLRRRNLIRSEVPRSGSNRAPRHTVNWDAVAKMGTTEPTYRLSCGRVRTNNPAAVATRTRRKARRLALASLAEIAASRRAG